MNWIKFEKSKKCWKLINLWKLNKIKDNLWKRVIHRLFAVIKHIGLICSMLV